MKTVSITTTYYSESRVLLSVATLNGFLNAVPEKQIKGVRADTVTLFETGAITPVDAQAVTTSQMRALVACNKELVEWLMAAQYKDKADQLPTTSPVDQPALPIDPVSDFEGALETPP